MISKANIIEINIYLKNASMKKSRQLACQERYFDSI